MNTTEAQLSRAAIKALLWMRDHRHHIARWLVGGRYPITERPETWTHIELRGQFARRRISREVWHETMPYREVSDNADHLFMPNAAGLALISHGPRHADRAEVRQPV
jgi:hypothetical protein